MSTTPPTSVSAFPDSVVQTEASTPFNAQNITPASARRPHRKSTLTQQQKNQKRQRATQEQLITLEHEFNKNPTPSGPVRERIADEINMTERSVQIWFQNRRAKIKNIAKRNIENGEDMDIPDSMKRYLSLHGLETPGADVSGSSRAGSLRPEDTGAVQHLACRSLTIGTWHRICQNSIDLLVFYTPDKRTMTYYINSESTGYKIEFPFSAIHDVSVCTSDSSRAEAAAQEQDGLLISLSTPPQFFMDTNGDGNFQRCDDFTQNQQASHILVHRIGGHSKVLRAQLEKMVSVESIMKHRQIPQQPTIITVSAPVSPVEGRPSSQPQQHMEDTMKFNFLGQGMLHPPRGHKRQRSRSVPASADFLRNQMPSFIMSQGTSHPLSENMSALSSLQQHQRQQNQQQPHHQHQRPLLVPSTINSQTVSEVNFGISQNPFAQVPLVGNQMFTSMSQSAADQLGISQMSLNGTFTTGTGTGYSTQTSSVNGTPFVSSAGTNDVYSMAARFGTDFDISNQSIQNFDIASPPIQTGMINGAEVDPMAQQAAAMNFTMAPMVNPAVNMTTQSYAAPFSPSTIATNSIMSAAQSPPIVVDPSNELFQIPQMIGNGVIDQASVRIPMESTKTDDSLPTPFPAFDPTMTGPFMNQPIDNGMQTFGMIDFNNTSIGLGLEHAASVATPMVTTDGYWHPALSTSGT